MSIVSVSFLVFVFYVVLGIGYWIYSDDVYCLLRDEKMFFFSANDIALLSLLFDGRIEVLFMLSG